jgi:outer membrane protein assembly factor BamB
MPTPGEREGRRWLGDSRLGQWFLAGAGAALIGILLGRRRRPVGAEGVESSLVSGPEVAPGGTTQGPLGRGPNAAQPPRIAGLERPPADPAHAPNEARFGTGGAPRQPPGSPAALSNLPAMPEPEERGYTRWLGNGGFRRWLLGGAGVVVVVVIAAVVFLLLNEPRNISHPDLSFTATTGANHATKPPVVTSDDFAWARYGYTATRTRDFSADADLRPPFRRGWTLRGQSLLEFPPVIFGHTLFFMGDNAVVKAIDTFNGDLRWQRTVGTLSSASPGLALRQGILVVPTLSDSGSSPGSGQIVALSMRTGKELWHHPLSPGSESSPLVWNRTVFYADQAGTVFSANVATGHINWTFQASGAVKGGAALSGDDLYVDDYGGEVYDIDARNGHKIWESSADGGDLGFSSGNFYSTPAVAFGRVYVGNTTGYVYSFAASTGQLAWSYGTGSYVYSSAAVADVPGLGPTIYEGSYNGNFYAFNARSGKVRWVHRDARGDRISGSATVINGIVYYSDLDDRLTTGLDARTGKTVFSFDDGAFSPVVADPGHIYLSGGYSLYELLPGDPPKPTAHATVTQRQTSPTTKPKTRLKRAKVKRTAVERTAIKRARVKRTAIKRRRDRR